jgi:hypothetical protein
MNLFWDSSALLSLVFSESSSLSAREAWDLSVLDLGWRWLEVEAVAGATRRRASPAQWSLLEQYLSQIRLIDLEKEKIPDLCAHNREWGLRAADAGHVYVFKEVTPYMPHLEMVCFDREIRTVVWRLGFLIWGDKPDGFGLARERRADYRTKKKKEQT